MSREELQAILDYILNKANDAEFEVISKACQRRVRDKTAFASLGGEGPAAMAKRMADDLQRNVGATMESVRGTVRGLVTDIIRKEAPEIDEEQLASLLDEYAPVSVRKSAGEAGRGSGPERRAGSGQADAPGIPSAAMLGMIRSFVEYSEGRMAPSRQRELWESDPRWQDSYWAAFPPEIKALAKAYLEGRIDGDTFGTATLSVLGL